MFEVNIYGAPPSIEKIRHMQAEFDEAEEHLMFKVLMFTPIPVVDALAAIATRAIREEVRGKDFRDCAGAATQDWSASKITQSYVEKVRAMGRELINLEVSALKRHMSVEQTARAVASSVADVAMTSGKEALHVAASAAGEALANGIKGMFSK
jgi:hypothetical protein